MHPFDIDCIQLLIATHPFSIMYAAVAGIVLRAVHVTRLALRGVR